MKKKFKSFVITAIAVVIIFGMTACDTSGGGGSGSTSALIGKCSNNDNGRIIEFSQDYPPARNRVAITAVNAALTSYSLVISENTATNLSGGRSFNFVLSNNNTTLTITNDTVSFGDSLNGVYTRQP